MGLISKNNKQAKESLLTCSKYLPKLQIKQDVFSNKELAVIGKDLKAQ